MSDAPWIVEMYSNDAPHMKQAHFNEEASARQMIKTILDHPDTILHCGDDRGFEFVFLPSTHNFVLVPPEIAAAMIAKAPQIIQSSGPADQSTQH